VHKGILLVSINSRSIPDDVMEIFIDTNPSHRTMALGSTHNRNECQEYFLVVNAAGA
jgi:hypothetical protein